MKYVCEYQPFEIDKKSQAMFKQHHGKMILITMKWIHTFKDTLINWEVFRSVLPDCVYCTITISSLISRSSMFSETNHFSHFQVLIATKIVFRLSTDGKQNSQ